MYRENFIFQDVSSLTSCGTANDAIGEGLAWQAWAPASGQPPSAARIAAAAVVANSAPCLRTHSPKVVAAKPPALRNGATCARPTRSISAGLPQNSARGHDASVVQTTFQAGAQHSGVSGTWMPAPGNFRRWCSEFVCSTRSPAAGTCAMNAGSRRAVPPDVKVQQISREVPARRWGLMAAACARRRFCSTLLGSCRSTTFCRLALPLQDVPLPHGCPCARCTAATRLPLQDVPQPHGCDRSRRATGGMHAAACIWPGRHAAGGRAHLEVLWTSSLANPDRFRSARMTGEPSDR